MKSLARSVIGTTAVLTLLVLGAPAGAEHGTPGTLQVVSRPGLGTIRAPTANNSFLNEDQFGNVYNAGRTVSDDGTRIVFASDADGLSTDDDNRYRNIFVRDRTTQTTILVSRAGLAGAGADADSFAPTISGDGSTVAFVSQAGNLGDGATGIGVWRIYVRVLATGVNKVASRATGPSGAIATNYSDRPSLDADGGKVAFGSYSALDATNDTTPYRDIYVRDLTTNTTTLVSRGDGATGAVGDNDSANPSISGNGARVAFDSAATNLIGAGNDTNGKRDIFVRDLAGGTTVLASRANTSTGVLGDGDSAAPSMSNDGTKVAFGTQAKNLDPTNDSNAGVDTYVRDLTANTIALGSRKNGSTVVAADSGSLYQPPTLSSDGTTVAFTSLASGVDPTVSPAWFSTYVHVLSTNVTKLASRGNVDGVAPDGLSEAPSLNGNGSIAVFDSVARNIDSDADPEFRGVYLRDLSAGTSTSVVRTGTNSDPFLGSGVNSSYSTPAAVSADGRYVVFTSKADTLSTEDDDRFTNVFVRDTLTDTTKLVSRADGAAGAAAEGDSVAGGISADGTKVLFVSQATNLVGGPAEYNTEAYVRNLVTNQTVRVTPLNTGVIYYSDPDNPSTRARISADGTKVVVETYAALDSAADTAPFSLDVYLLNADGTGLPVLVDRADGPSGDISNGLSSPTGISADGSRVVFESYGSNLTPDDPNTNEDVFVRDVDSSHTMLVSRADGAAGAVGDSQSQGGSISADGTKVAFVSYACNLVPLTNCGQIYVRDLAAGSTRLVSRDDGASGTEAAGNPVSLPDISADGSRVAFAFSTPNLNGYSNPNYFTNVYVRNMTTNVTTMLSHAAGTPTVSGNGPSTYPAISGNGDCVAFKSYASDLLSGFTGGTDFGYVYLGTVARECPVVAPDTTLTSGPTGTINNRRPTFTFAKDDATAHFECKLDAGAFATCPSPYTTPSLADGSHTFTVRAVDPAGYVDATPPSRVFKVDATPPETTITSGPSGTVATRAASFAFRATEAATFKCSLDGAPALACTSPRTYNGLADGSHTFAVVATDGVGNRDASPAARSWKVDATAPGPSLSVPKQKLGAVLRKGLRLKLGSTETSTYALTVDIRGPKLFGKRSGGLAAGQALVTVRALPGAKKALAKKRSATLLIRFIVVDAAGNPSPVVTRRIKLKR